MRTYISVRRGFAPIIPIVAIVVVLAGAVWFASSRDTSDSDAMMDKPKDVMMDKPADAMMEKPKDVMMDKPADSMMDKPADAMMDKPKDTMMDKPAGSMMIQKGGYVAYSADKLAFAEKGKVVLFFHAPWCPYCRTADTNLNKELSAIPSDLLILKTDYDSMTALKQKYGVTYQHTFVQVDASGNQIAKWSGSEKLSDIVANLK